MLNREAEIMLVVSTYPATNMQTTQPTNQFRNFPHPLAYVLIEII